MALILFILDCFQPSVPRRKTLPHCLLSFYCQFSNSETSDCIKVSPAFEPRINRVWEGIRMPSTQAEKQKSSRSQRLLYLNSRFMFSSQNSILDCSNYKKKLLSNCWWVDQWCGCTKCYCRCSDWMKLWLFRSDHKSNHQPGSHFKGPAFCKRFLWKHCGRSIY